MEYPPHSVGALVLLYPNPWGMRSFGIPLKGDSGFSLDGMRTCCLRDAMSFSARSRVPPRRHLPIWMCRSRTFSIVVGVPVPEYGR